MKLATYGCNLSTTYGMATEILLLRLYFVLKCNANLFSMGLLDQKYSKAYDSEISNHVFNHFNVY